MSSKPSRACALDLQTEFHVGEMHSILKQICKVRKKKYAYIASFPRFGFSGARLLLLSFNRGQEDGSLIVKIGPEQEIRKELQATEKISDLSDDADLLLAERKLFSSGKRGAVLYRYRGKILQHDKPITLREAFFSNCTVGNTQSQFSDNAICEIISNSYKKLLEAHKCGSIKTIKIRHHYADYFRHDQANGRIRRILGDDIQGKRFLAGEICDPLETIESLKDQKVKIQLGYIHGDFHPDNIVIDSEQSPSIVDFAWAKEQCDVLLDFVLLENSIRFNHFPTAVNLNIQCKIDKFLIRKDIFAISEATKFIETLGMGEMHSDYKRDCIRLLSAVSTIRENAKNLLGDGFNMKDYLRTQFITLYGLMRYPRYEQYNTVRALGMMAKEVMRHC